MSPTGFANWSYVHRQRRRLPSVKTTKVVCGTGYLEGALDEDLHTIGLGLPDGILSVDKEKSEINIFRSLALFEKGPLVFYSRLYATQPGTKELVADVDRMLRRAYRVPLDEDFLSRQFEKYLVDNLDFTEKATFGSDGFPEAEIQGTVSFHCCEESVVPIEEGKYWIFLREGFIDKISDVYRHNCGRDLSARRRKILTGKDDPLKLDTFLRAIDIRPASSKYQNNKVYRNLRKCTSFLADITFKDAMHPYSVNFPTLGDRHKQK